ncbi:MAG: hypothetical protein IT313_08935 [Anaerolineales bacterium]|nr:hypothetical protein [Anaerolineales bacterium]
MAKDFFKNSMVAIGAGLTFVGFVLDILDVRQWWDRVVLSLFQNIGIQSFSQSAFFQLFFWLSFAFSLTLFGVAVILLGKFLQFMLTDFKLRAFSLDFDFGDLSSSILVRQIVYGVIWITVFFAMFVLVIGEYPSWNVVRLFLVAGLPFGVIVSLFIGAIGGVLGETPKNLAFALFGITLGSVVSIVYWNGMNFTPRIAILGLLGSCLGLPVVRIKLWWGLVILLIVFGFLISLLGGIP